ncbi:hypothetical protein Taro_015112 [Colocasia esculenta]|uniref:TLC domain-containing protein n=1 Tax=Colocasia esculenta TaxID=4460 RepID=A0A843UJZ0_COLES|nr:hypothetical protein [Colocasia esculenta]
MEMEGYNIMRSWVLPGVALWAAVFVLVRRALPRRSFDFCNRVVSTVHATLAVFLAMHIVQDWRCPVCPLGARSSLLQMRTLSVTLSYLIYDAVCGLFDKRVNLENLIHHTVGILGIGAGLAYEMCGTEMVATIWVTEISSPFLHLRELLKELGYRDTDLNLAVDIAFAAIFSFARMVCGPYITTVTLLEDYPLLIKATALGLQLVSTFWFCKIVRMVLHKMAKRRRQTKIVVTSVCV